MSVIATSYTIAGLKLRFKCLVLIVVNRVKASREPPVSNDVMSIECTLNFSMDGAFSIKNLYLFLVIKAKGIDVINNIIGEMKVMNGENLVQEC